VEYVVNDRKQESMESYFCQFTERSSRRVRRTQWTCGNRTSAGNGILEFIRVYRYSPFLTPLSYISAAVPGTELRKHPIGGYQTLVGNNPTNS
jgi:hypothetical protein